ncbi:MAG: LD-carboxypeptidase, partial [Muribaculaceae bacterium]|nr:LD-carboxypeptidase [Muribaculaceae bacterium]
MEVKSPDPLKRGDKIAILSPATTVAPEYVAGAADFFAKKGYEPVVLAGAIGPASGSFASSLEQRIEDLRYALRSEEIKGILCARGGYGCVHLLSELSEEEIAAHPKWLIGFSDISALHALWLKAGVCSIHGPMAKHITLEDEDDFCACSLLDILSGKREVTYKTDAHPFNREGEACGMLKGGNLAVLNGLASTPYDILEVREGEDVILFLEDVSEAIYAVERMLTRLYLSGTLRKIKGLIVGQFTEYRPDRNHKNMEAMIDSFLRRYAID